MRSGSPPNYERPRRPSLVDAVEPEISKLLKNCPTMAASVIAERLDWPHGITILRDRVAELFHVPALQLERVMDESRTGHRLEVSVHLGLNNSYKCRAFAGVKVQHGR